MKSTPSHSLTHITVAFLLFTGLLAGLYVLSGAIPLLGRHLTESFAVLFLFTPMVYFHLVKAPDFIRFGAPSRGLLWGLAVSIPLLLGYALFHWIFFKAACGGGLSLSLGRNCATYTGSFSWPLKATATLNLFLVHTIAVALPEEYFYRGFVMGLLFRSAQAKKWDRRRAVVIVVLLQALFFGLGHALVDGNPLRFAVFFPALIFGILAIKSETLIAPILFHGLANTLSEILEKGWFQS